MSKIFETDRKPPYSQPFLKSIYDGGYRSFRLNMPDETLNYLFQIHLSSDGTRYTIYQAKASYSKRRVTTRIKRSVAGLSSAGLSSRQLDMVDDFVGLLKEMGDGDYAQRFLNVYADRSVSEASLGDDEVKFDKFYKKAFKELDKLGERLVKSHNKLFAKKPVSDPALIDSIVGVSDDGDKNDGSTNI